MEGEDLDHAGAHRFELGNFGICDSGVSRCMETNGCMADWLWFRIGRIADDWISRFGRKRPFQNVVINPHRRIFALCLSCNEHRSISRHETNVFPVTLWRVAQIDTI